MHRPNSILDLAPMDNRKIGNRRPKVRLSIDAAFRSPSPEATLASHRTHRFGSRSGVVELCSPLRVAISDKVEHLLRESSRSDDWRRSWYPEVAKRHRSDPAGSQRCWPINLPIGQGVVGAHAHQNGALLDQCKFHRSAVPYDAMSLWKEEQPQGAEAARASIPMRRFGHPLTGPGALASRFGWLGLSDGMTFTLGDGILAYA